MVDYILKQQNYFPSRTKKLTHEQIATCESLAKKVAPLEVGFTITEDLKQLFSKTEGVREAQEGVRIL